MSQEDVDIVRHVLAAGRDYITELLDSEIQLDLSDRVFNPATFDGYQGVRRWSNEVSEIWDGYTLEPRELFDGEGAVVAIVRERGRGRTSGVVVDRDITVLCRLREGLVSEIRLYADREQAMRDAGLDG